MVKNYMKKPVVIRAIQYDGNNRVELHECYPNLEFLDTFDDDAIHIKTLEGYLEACPGDYIIEGVRGEYYPCRQDIFEETYEEVTE